MVAEEWKVHPVYVNYEISTKGRVRNNYTGKGVIKGKILKTRVGTGGYMQIVLANPKSNKNIHRLVAEAFIPNPENKPCVNHKDGNKLNNCVENLEWCTYSENTIHARQNGLIPHREGEKHNRAQLTENQIIEILDMFYNRGFSYVEICTLFNKSKSHIVSITNGTKWTTTFRKFVYSNMENYLKRRIEILATSTSRGLEPLERLTTKEEHVFEE